MSKEISRRALIGFAGGAVALAVVGAGVDHRVNSGADLGERPLDGKLREEGIWNVRVHGYRDQEGKYYKPTFRVGPSIEDRELTAEEVEERGYSTAHSFRTKGEKVFGDSGDQAQPVKMVGDGAVAYHGWTKLSGGEYISENFVDYGKKVDARSLKR